MTREEEIRKERLKKIEELKKQGNEPYKHRFQFKDHAIELHKKYEKLKEDEKTKDKVSLAGRVVALRIHGKINFATLQDSTGRIQLCVEEQESGSELCEFLKNFVDSGDVIGIEGIIFKTKRGELTVLVKKLELLTKSIAPLPDKWHGLQDKEERYRQRYVDLIMNPEVKEVFMKRSKIIEAMREFLISKSFIEVETPVLQPIYGGASAKPFESKLNALDMKVYMRISNEMYLKRLIVGGYEKIFEFSKDFRNEGVDWAHNPEFLQMETMWAYANYEDNMKFNEEIIAFIAKKVLGTTKIEYRDKQIDLTPPFKRIEFKDAVMKETKIDINKADNFEKLKKEIISKKLTNVDVNRCFHYGALLDELYKRVIRPKIIQPTFLTHYPVEMIALAKRNEKDRTKINSFQLLIDGMEISKSYDELNDPEDQKVRLEEQNQLLKKGDQEAMPIDKEFIEALEYGMPPTSGLGVGVDRLVMVLTNTASIRDVILFPFMRPEK